MRTSVLESSVLSLQPAKVRYTTPNAETTAGEIDVSIEGGDKPLSIRSAAFFISRLSLWATGWMEPHKGSPMPSLVRQLPLWSPTQLTLSGRFISRTEGNTMARAKSSSTATPTHFFYPKFKKGDICRLKRCTSYPELNGLTVTLQSDLIATKNRLDHKEYWLGYEVDLVYKGFSFCFQEDQLTKIGEVSL